MIKFYTKLRDVEKPREISSLIGRSDEYTGKGIGTIINTPTPKGVAVYFDEEGTPCGFIAINLEDDREFVIETMYADKGKEECYKELYYYASDLADRKGYKKISAYPDSNDDKLIEFYQDVKLMFAKPQNNGDYIFMTKFVDKKYNRIGQILNYLEAKAKGTNVLSYSTEERRKRENSFVRNAEKTLKFDVMRYIDSPLFIASAMLYEEMSARGKRFIDLKKAVAFKDTQPKYYADLKKSCSRSFGLFEKWIVDGEKALEAKEIHKNHLVANEQRNKKKEFLTSAAE